MTVRTYALRREGTKGTHASVKMKELRSDARKATGINSPWWCAQTMCLYMFGKISTFPLEPVRTS